MTQDYFETVVPSQLFAERGSNVVVINPGSANIRIGLAKQDAPISVPHCISRRTSQVPKKNVQDQMARVDVFPSQNNTKKWGSFLFLVRVLFASIFILSTWQMYNEFGEDGGPTAEKWAPKLAIIKKYIDGIIGKNDLHIDARAFVGSCIFLKGLGGLLFVVGHSYGAFLLIYYLILTTPLSYDFYNYKTSEPQFSELLHDFLQCAALVGALLFFLGMRSSILRWQF